MHFSQGANLQNVAQSTGGKEYFASDKHGDDSLEQVATDSASIGCDDEDAEVVVSVHSHIPYVIL